MPAPPYRYMSVVALAVVTGVSNHSPAQSPSPTPTADGLIALKLRLHTADARRDVAAAEVAALPAGAAPVRKSVGTLKNPDAVLSQIKGPLEKGFVALNESAAELKKSTADRVSAAREPWTAAYRDRVAVGEWGSELGTAYGFDPDGDAPAPFRPTAVDLSVLAAAGLALLVSIYLARHERRVARRARRAMAGAVGLVVAAASGCGGGPAGGPTSWITREHADLTARVTAAEEAADAAEREAAARWQRYADGWARLVAVDPDRDVANAIVGRWAAARQAATAAAVDARLAARLAGETADLRTSVPAEQARLAGLASSSRFREWAFSAVRLAAAVGLLGLVLAPYTFARRASRRAIAGQARECPRCSARDKLTAGRAAEQDDRYPEPEYIECGKCTYRFRRSYLTVPRVCFPTVGMRSAGKTQMLVTAYDRVRSGAVPSPATVIKAPSLGDDLFDQYIDLLLRGRTGAGATVHALPDPIILHVRDADRAGPNPVLVNLFDYSGEIMNSRVDTDLLRRRAVEMNGFMMFVDPTQIYGDDANLRIEDQVKALHEFYEDMREQRRVPVGESIPVPVALCIPKFDLLLSDTPLGGQAIPYTRRLLNDLTPPGPVSLADLTARSALVEEMLPMMFMGIDLVRILRGYFGDRVMFFPMSSVSLIESELGVKDLSTRTIAPYGVIEPVLWLLHMHGYEVLADGPAGTPGGRA